MFRILCEYSMSFTVLSIYLSFYLPNRLFRTMGVRHLVINDGENQVVGMVTRADMNEHTLQHYWQAEVSIV